MKRYLPFLALLALTLSACDQHEPMLTESSTDSSDLALSKKGGTTLKHGLPGRIVFHSNCDGDSEIYVMNADGTGLTQLTHNKCPSDAVPGWTPTRSL